MMFAKTSLFLYIYIGEISPDYVYIYL